MQQYLRPFHKRLVLEAVLFAVVLGLLTGVAALFVYLLFLHIWSDRSSLQTAVQIFAFVFLLFTAISYLFMFRPRTIDTARRMDALGLDERVETMLRHQHENSPMILLQRADTMECIKKVSPKQIVVRFPRKQMITIVILGVLVIILLFCPYANVSAALQKQEVDEEDIARTAESARIAEMIDMLRKQVTESNLSDEQKQALLDQLSQMESSFDLNSVGLEELAQMSQFYQDVTLDLSSLEIYGSLTGELLKYEELRALGEAISVQDQTAVRKFFREMEQMLLDDIQAAHIAGVFSTIIKDLQAVIDAAKESEEEQSLAYIFKTLKTNLDTQFERSLAGEDVSSALHTSLYRAGEYICLSFSGEMPEEVSAQMVEGETQQSETSESSGDGRQNGMGEAEGMSQSLFAQGAEGVSMGLSTENGKEKTAATEHMYEPSLDVSADYNYVPDVNSTETVDIESNHGNVAYETVYGLYYAQMLEAIESGNISEELLDIIENYFYGL